MTGKPLPRNAKSSFNYRARNIYRGNRDHLVVYGWPTDRPRGPKGDRPCLVRSGRTGRCAKIGTIVHSRVEQVPDSSPLRRACDIAPGAWGLRNGPLR